MPDLDIDELVRLKRRTMPNWLPTARKAPSKKSKATSSIGPRLVGAGRKRKGGKKKSAKKKVVAKPLALGQEWKGWDQYRLALAAEKAGSKETARKLLAKAEAELRNPAGSRGFMAKAKAMAARLGAAGPSPASPAPKKVGPLPPRPPSGVFGARPKRRQYKVPE